MNTTQLHTSTATELADAVRSGSLSAEDVVTAHLQRIDRLDGTLSAFQTVRRGAALQEAAGIDHRPDRAELPLAGVPVAVKSNIAVAGEPSQHGSAAVAASPCPNDDEIVTRLRRAGAIVIGTTRMCELAAWGFTSGAAFGPTRNPWDTGLDPGGSTGGGAVAVAAGMAALAVGTDGGGSLRIPAAYCGVVGLKPTRGTVPLPGGLAEHWCGLSVAGPMARTVQDVRTLYAVLAASGSVPADRPGRAAARLRVAVSLKSPSPIATPDAQQIAAVETAADALRAQGHDVTVANPPYPPTLLQRWQRRWWAGIAQDADGLGAEVDDLEPRTRAMVAKGRRVLRFGGPRPSVARSWRDRAEAWFADYDVLLSPAVARGPLRAGEFDGRGYLPTFLAAAKGVPFCQAWNLAGFPALVVPVGLRHERPLAVQLVGVGGNESTLMDVGAALEVPQRPPLP